MAVTDREFAELHADVKNLVEEFDDFRAEVRARLSDGALQFKRQELAEAEMKGMRRVAMWIGGSVLTAAGFLGSYAISWFPTLFEWLRHK